MATTAFSSPDLLANLQQHFNSLSQNTIKSETVENGHFLDHQQAAQLSILQNLQNQTSSNPVTMAAALLLNQYSMNMFSSHHLSKFFFVELKDFNFFAKFLCNNNTNNLN